MLSPGTLCRRKEDAALQCNRSTFHTINRSITNEVRSHFPKEAPDIIILVLTIIPAPVAPPVVTVSVIKACTIATVASTLMVLALTALVVT